MKIRKTLVSWKLLHFIFSICFGCFFLILAVCWPVLFKIILQTQLQLDPSSTLYRMWVENPLPIFLEIYVFNFTNANEFLLNKSTTPNFEEIGPFLFEENRRKVGVLWSDTEESVTFNQTKQWRLVEDKSQNFYLPITNINPISLTIAHISRLWTSNLQKTIANTLINKHEPLLVTASVREWLFEGIPDKFLDILKTLRKVSDIPIPYDKFGWFYERNASSSFDGTFKISTGKSTLKNLGMMISWNNLTRTEFYKDHCGLVFGSTGEVLPPLDLYQKNLSVFSSEICSYVTLKFSKPSSMKGIDCYQYEGDESVFDNGTLHPENSCFYPDESCASGSRNVSQCRFGSPAFISFPHFYLADPDYNSRLTGLKADEKKHRFILKVEPKTGLPLSVDGSFQINFLMKPYPWCDAFREVPEVYIPMIWFKQTVEISDEYAFSLKLLLFFYKYGAYVFWAISILSLLSFSIFKIYRYLISNK